MGISHYIGALVLSAVVSFGSVEIASAQSPSPLSKTEQRVCANLSACLDIVARHDASEFDYNVLATEFMRFGPKGRAGLFRVLESKAGTADVARLIAAEGKPLSPSEAAVLKKNWSPARMAMLLPLLSDKSVRSRDYLMSAVAQPDDYVRAQALQTLAEMPKAITRVPLTAEARADLLAAAVGYPDKNLAPFLARLQLGEDRDAFAALLLTGEPYTVMASYDVLYRDAPGPAFQTLLKQLSAVQTPQQAEALGTMLADRHARRADGFYAKFMAEMSGNSTFPPLARAAGLHGYMLTLAQKKESRQPAVPPYTAARKAALDALFTQPSEYLYTYFVGLNQQDDPLAQTLIGGVWSAVMKSPAQVDLNFLEQTRKVPNRARLLQTQIRTGRLDQVAAALRELKTTPEPALRSVLLNLAETSPSTAIRAQAQQLSGRPLRQGQRLRATCALPKQDLKKRADQMPYFDAGEARIKETGAGGLVINRHSLASAHATKSGWLAGYNGGEYAFGLVHFDNQTGFGQPVDLGVAPNILAVLPDRPLRLGETADRFWVVSYSAIKGGAQLWRVENASGRWKASRLSGLLDVPTAFGVTPAGNLILHFDEGTLPAQPPLAISPSGDIGLACSKLPATAPVQVNP